MEADASPFANPENRAWVDAALAGKLLLGRCRACGAHHYYTRPFCPFCFSQDVEGVEATGMATIFSYTIARTAQPPTIVAYVTLSEGPTMLTNVVDAAVEEVRIGRTVELTFRDSQLGFPAPMFRIQR
jgi:uncharacterized OB-fold protein